MLICLLLNIIIDSTNLQKKRQLSASTFQGIPVKRLSGPEQASQFTLCLANTEKLFHFYLINIDNVVFMYIKYTPLKFSMYSVNIFRRIDWIKLENLFLTLLFDIFIQAMVGII